MTLLESARVTVQSEVSREESLLKEQQKQHFHILRHLLKYTRYTLRTPSLGRCMLGDVGLIYWPGLSSVSLRNLRRLVYPDALCEQDCENFGFTAPPQDYLLRRCKELTETALRPLLFSPWSRIARTHIARFALELDQATHDAPGVHPQRRDPRSYTVFRRYLAKEKTQQRLFTRPLEKDPNDPFRDVIPVHMVLLHDLWFALYDRTENGFDSIDAGVDYLPSGVLCVNWRRYLPALAKNQVPGVHAPVPVEAREITAAFETMGPALGGMLVAHRGTEFFAKFHRQAQALELASDEDAAFLSFFDLSRVFQGKHERLFKGSWYYYRKEVTRQKRAALNQGLRERDITRLPHAHPLLFKPWEYIRFEVEKGVLPKPWFPEDYEELIYTVRSRKQFCFRRPALLSEAQHKCPAETEAWKRALDSFHIIEAFDPENPDALQKLELSELKSSFLKRARVEFLERVARDLIRDFDGLDGLRSRDLKRVRRHAQQTYALEQSTQHSGNTRWYHDGVLKRSLEIPNILDLRAQVTVLYPNETEPRREIFFRPDAIRTFLKFAQPPKYSNDVAENPLQISFNEAWRPAPYVLAWARFCLEMGQKADLYRHELKNVADVEVTTQWTPQEDLDLLMHYRTYPALTREEWFKLLGMLHDRNQHTVHVRLMKLRTILRRVLDERSLKHHWPGSLYQNEIQARQTVLIVGLATKRKIPHSRGEEAEPVRRVLRWLPERTMSIRLPSAYSKEYFANFQP